MGGKSKDLTGVIFDRLTVIKFSKRIGKRNYWICQCSCGNPNLKEVSQMNLIGKNSTSCGCKAIEKRRKYNRYDISGEYGIGYTNKGKEFYFDLEDYDLIKGHCWRLSVDEYIETRDFKSKKRLLLSRLVMNETMSSIQIDHIDRNKSDNRKSNLRKCVVGQNTKNKSLSSLNKTGYIGVSLTTYGTFRSAIKSDGITYGLGSYSNIEDALVARLKAEKQYFGEFAPQRHLFKQYNI